MNNAKHYKKVLLGLINSLSTDHRDFIVNPLSDFTRTRKLSLSETLKFMLCWEAGSLKDELYNYFGLNIDNPTISAFIQQRSKIKLDAFVWLFHQFNQLTYNHKRHLFRGYRLLAVDGSTIRIRKDKNDIYTYCQKNDFNAYHLNVMFDILEHTYQDFVIQNEPEKCESRAFEEMVDRYKGPKTIFIADRGYESYNSCVHVMHSNNKYLIRVKDIDSSSSMTRGLHLNMFGEFDVNVNRILTTKQTNVVKANPQKYKIMTNGNHFEFLNKENPYFEFNCRIVRFKITDDTYETIITNLSRDEFGVEDIKSLYNMRWGVETSFRELKYNVDLVAFHSKKNNFILQEICIRMLFYNFSERIIQKIKPKQSKHDRVHLYKVNSAVAFRNIRAFLKSKKGEKSSPIEAIIAKEIEPVRFGRFNPRKVITQTEIYFTYR